MMEPERKIEKLLRDFARKRREEPGDALELNPATRRRLQAEAARRAPKRAEGNLFLRLRSLTRPAFAFAASLAVAGLFASLLLPALSKARSRSTSIGAANNLRQIGIAAILFADDHTNRLPDSLDEMKGLLGSDKVLNDPVTGQPFVYVGAGRDLNTLPKDTMLAYSPADGKNRRVLFSDGSVQTVSSSHFEELSSGPMQLATASDSRLDALKKEVAPAAAPVPAVALETDAESRAKRDLPDDRSRAAEPAAVGGFAGKLTESGSQVARSANREYQPVVQFRRIGATGATTNVALAQKSFDADADVLTSFAVQQNGRVLRIVDGDGSVYEGVMRPENAPESKLLADAPTNETARGKPAEPAQNFVFTCEGTNRSLQQNVVFSGSLVVLGAPAGAGARAQNAAASTTPAVPGPAGLEIPFSLPLTNSSIRGTVQLEKRTFQLNAAPAETPAR